MIGGPQTRGGAKMPTSDEGLPARKTRLLMLAMSVLERSAYWAFRPTGLKGAYDFWRKVVGQCSEGECAAKRCNFSAVLTVLSARVNFENLCKTLNPSENPEICLEGAHLPLCNVSSCNTIACFQAQVLKYPDLFGLQLRACSLCQIVLQYNRIIAVSH